MPCSCYDDFWLLHFHPDCHRAASFEAVHLRQRWPKVLTEGKAALDAEGLVQSSRKTLDALKCFLSTINDVDRKLLPTFQTAELDLLQELSQRNVGNEIKDLKAIGDDGSKIAEELEVTMSSLKAWMSERGEATFKIIFEWVSNLWGPESNIAVAPDYATKAGGFINSLRGAGALAALVGPIWPMVCFKRRSNQ